jgi:tetratricopeptide (TPR) repeat protein
MNLLPGITKKTFNLLSIGQRGVGKTVFLAGSYAELHPNSQVDHSQKLWFDCQDKQVQENIENILNYIARTGQYPPPTMKITDFNFSLKHLNLWGVQTLCHFHWWDIPGEICNIRNPDFQEMVSTSHACCVFIDAYALAHKPAYLQTQDIIQQVMTIASLVSLNRLEYAFALVLTKCDLLKSDLLSRSHLEESLQPLTTHLDDMRANYQVFYSDISIARTEGGSTLKATGAAASLLWLVWELSKTHNVELMNSPLKLVTRLLPRSLQPRQDLVDRSLQDLFRPTGRAVGVKKILGLYLLPTARRNLLLLTLAIVGLVGVISLLSVDYEWGFQRQPNNLDALNQAEPQHLKLRLQLAQSYKTAGQVAEAEALYNEVLTKQKNNLKALVGKAVLRHAQGDTKTAETLFVQAEKAAPDNLKGQVRTVAQETLQMPHKSVPSGQ